jgi:hypothetical protein
MTPTDLERLPLGRRLQLTAEILAAYLRVRLAMRGEDAELAVRTLRERAEAPPPSSWGKSEELVAAWRLARVTKRVLGPLPADSRCLFRSLTLMSLLQRRGIENVLVIAVRPQPFGAHAWIEVDGQPVLPEADPRYERLLEL